MKRFIFFAAFSAILMQGAVIDADDAGQAVPVAVIPEPAYAFEPVAEGTEISHDFQVLNKGTAMLSLQVKPG
ncbi:MAG: hypothetical protein R6U50_10265 [Desulfobacterales bacterium]